jgi:ABC-type microcin C transport system duplicated ATPase subunit YejF
MTGNELIEVKDIGMTFEAEKNPVRALQDVSFNVKEGEFLSSSDQVAVERQLCLESLVD